MAGGEVESAGGRRNEHTATGSPGVASRDRESDRNLEVESPTGRNRITRTLSEESSDYSEEREEDRRQEHREERREKELDRDRDRRHRPMEGRTSRSVRDVELGSKDGRYSSFSDEDGEKDEVVEGETKIGRSGKADMSRRHDTSEDESEEEEIVRGTHKKKRKSRMREKSGRRHSLSGDEEGEEDEIVVGTPTERSRSRKREKSRKRNDRKSSRRRHRRARSESTGEDSSDSDEPSSSSSDISGSEDEVQREKERRRRKKKRRRKEREREQEKEIRRKEKRKRKELKEKKLKSDKKKKKREMRSKQPITTSWGKYGIIKDIDMWNKRPEFSAWLAEVKKVNMETLSNWEEKQMFKEYMEDYNTATFPSKKYYNLDIYHRRKMVKARMKGMAKVAKAERTDFNDEEQRRLELRKEREQKKEEDVELLMRTMQSGMAQAMREQAQLREEMQYQFRLGNVEAAQAIQRRLDPDADKLAKL